MFVAPLLLAAALATSPPAASAPKPHTLTHFEWARLPSADDMVGHYPPRAETRGVSGWAVIGCHVDANGKLFGCKVAAEAPNGYGFGAATLAVAPKFEMKAPPSGADLSNARVTIPVTWKLPGGVVPPVDFGPGTPAMVVTVASGSERRTGFFACPSKTDRFRHCQAHRIEWETHPNVEDIDDLIKKARGGASSMECTIGDTGALENCVMANSEPQLTDADFIRISKLFKAPERTEDRVLTKGKEVVLSFDWGKLATVLDALDGP